MCVGDVEHLFHLFFDCGFAKVCWQQVGMDYDTQNEEHASEWLLNKLNTESKENMIKISAVLWGIWFARNKRIFEGKNMTPAFVMDWSTKQIAEWRSVNKITGLVPADMRDSERQEIHRWQPPQVGKFKVNVDASVFAGQNSFAVGMVLRNWQGHYISGKTMRFADNVKVMEAEMVGILETLTWLEVLPAPEVIIESDSLMAVNAINKDHTNLLEQGNMVQHCRTLMRERGGVSLEFVRKRANKVAHKMARIPCELDSFIVNSSPPLFLLETILSDTLI